MSSILDSLSLELFLNADAEYNLLNNCESRIRVYRVEHDIWVDYLEESAVKKYNMHEAEPILHSIQARAAYWGFTTCMFLLEDIPGPRLYIEIGGHGFEVIVK